MRAWVKTFREMEEELGLRDFYIVVRFPGELRPVAASRRHGSLRVR